MKKIFVLFFILFVAFSAGAQKTAVDKAVDSSCRCLEAVKEKIKSPEDFDKLGQGCIIKSALPYIEDISKEEKIPLEELNEDIGEKLGQKIGLKLITNCPVFLDLIALYANDEEEEDVVTGKTSGAVSAVEINDHVYLNVKEASGKMVKVVWVEYFPGSDEYKTNPGSLKGKEVEVNWKQSEVYNVAQKDFVTVKQVTKLKVN